MQNEMRNRLIRLIDNADEECKHSKSCEQCAGYQKGSMCMNYHIADKLIKNGVIVPPCKVGDIVYQVDTLFEETMITELKVVELTIDNKGIKTLYGITEKGSTYGFVRNYNLDQIKFTKQDAEHALRKEN